jgi:hypothetical protein
MGDALNVLNTEAAISFTDEEYSMYSLLTSWLDQNNGISLSYGSCLTEFQYLSILKFQISKYL